MAPFFWAQKPSPISTNDDEDEESLLSDTNRIRGEKSWHTSHANSFPKICLFVVSYCLVASLGIWLGSNWGLNSAAVCAKLSTRYSPVVKEVGLSYHTVQYNGSFFNLNAFRQDAGPEVDAAWESLGVDYRSAWVPAEQAARSGLSPDQVKIKDKYGGGYPANVEGLHHLHCLNLLRKSLHYNFEYYHALGKGAFQNDDLILKTHITHCLDILRQQLMCSVDMGMLGQVWWDRKEPKPFVDFNTKHVCRNFEAVRQWAEEKQLPADAPIDFLEMPKEGDRIYDAVP